MPWTPRPWPSYARATCPSRPTSLVRRVWPARLDRALVIGPHARLELTPRDQPNHILEADLSAEEYRRLGVKEGDTVSVSPRKARVFLEVADDPAALI